MAGTLRFVSAGAGSGKTYRLTQILHEKLSSGQARPAGVIATTFTRKAATELRERVRTALLEKGEFALANSIGQARIGTVNSVCGGFLERFAFEAGLATEQRVLEEAQSGVLVREAIDAVSDSATVQELVELARRLGIESWEDALKALIDHRHAQPPEVKRCKRLDHPDPSVFMRPGVRGRWSRLRPSGCETDGSGLATRGNP